MKSPALISGLLLSLGLAIGANAANSNAGYFDIGSLKTPASGECVEVKLQSGLLSFAAKVAEKSDPDAAQFLRNIKGVHVNVVKIDDSNRSAVTDSLAEVATKLAKEGWEEIVTVKEQKGDKVHVYLKSRGDECIEGVVVTVQEGDKEAVFVNVVGEIRPEEISKLGAKLELEPLKKLKVKISSDGKSASVTTKS